MNDQAVATRNRDVMTLQPGSSAPITPMEMLNQAIERGANIEVLEKLMALQERWEAAQGRKAFDAAVADAKAEISPVIRNARSHNGKYADFAAIARAVDPALSKQGLSYRFRSEQTDKALTVTCILRHKAGHNEETTLTGPVDTSGNKTPIQGIGSSATYLQRYTLILALGLAAAHDDDGKAVVPVDDALLSAVQLEKLRARVIEVGGGISGFLERLLKKLKVNSLDELYAANFERVMQILDEKEKELANGK